MENMSSLASLGMTVVMKGRVEVIRIEDSDVEEMEIKEQNPNYKIRYMHITISNQRGSCNKGKEAQARCRCTRSCCKDNWEDTPEGWSRFTVNSGMESRLGQKWVENLEKKFDWIMGGIMKTSENKPKFLVERIFVKREHGIGLDTLNIEVKAHQRKEYKGDESKILWVDDQMLKTLQQATDEIGKRIKKYRNSTKNLEPYDTHMLMISSASESPVIYELQRNHKTVIKYDDGKYKSYNLSF